MQLAVHLVVFNFGTAFQRLVHCLLSVCTIMRGMVRLGLENYVRFNVVVEYRA